MRKLLVGEARCRASCVRYYLLEEASESGGSYGVQVELDGEEEFRQHLQILHNFWRDTPLQMGAAVL